MMKIKNVYTSYYGNLKNIPDEFLKVSISRFLNPQLQEQVDIWDTSLAPTKGILNNYKQNPDINKYAESFKKEVIKDTDYTTLFSKWQELFPEKEKVVLLCYETAKKPDFCHRHIVAEDIERRLKINVDEYGYKHKQRKNYELIDASGNCLF